MLHQLRSNSEMKTRKIAWTYEILLFMYFSVLLGAVLVSCYNILFQLLY